MTDLMESHCSWPVMVRFLHSSGGWGTLTSSLGSQLFARSLSSCRFTGSLLCTGHFKVSQLSNECWANWCYSFYMSQSRQVMAVMGKHRLWESTEYGSGGKVQKQEITNHGSGGKAQIMGKCRIWLWWESTDYGKAQNMVEMGKHRLWESAEYGSDGKVQIMWLE